MNGLGQRIALWIAAGLIVAAPLPLGGRGRMAVAVMALAGTAGLVALLADRHRLPAPPARLALVGLLALLLPVLQLVPLPPPVLETLSPRLAEEARASLALPGAEPDLVAAERTVAERAGGERPALAWRPLSADPEKTFHGALRLSAGLAAALLGLLGVRDRRDRRLLLAALAASAVFQAVYGLAELLSGHEHIFHIPKTEHLGAATGTFVNPNHYGALLSLGMFAVLGLLHDLWRQRDQEDPGRAPKASLAATAAALIVIALIWSASRGALACAAGGLVVWAALTLPRLASPGARRVAAGLVAGLILILVAGAVWMRPPQALIDNLERQGLSPENRLQMWSDGAEMLAAFPATGTGLGTYGTVAELFRSPDLPRRPVHAHSDYLEWCVEVGIPGAAVVLALLVIVIGGAWSLLRRRSDRALTAALTAGLLALAVHEVAEFSLQLAGVALPAAVALGALLAPWTKRSTEGPRTSHRGGSGPRTLWAALIAASALATLVTGAGTLVADRRASPAAEEPPGGVTLPSTLRSWGRARVSELLDRAVRDPLPPRRPAGPRPELAESLGPPLIALQRAAQLAPLRPEPQLALWTATQAFVAAHSHRDELAPVVAPLLAHYLRRAEALAPSDRERHLVLARYWLTMGRPDEARRVVRQLLHMAPERAAEAYELLGGEALDLSDLLAATPNEPDAAIRLSRYLWRRGDRVGAQLVLERALSRAPGSWRLRERLAGRLLHRDREARALEVLDHQPPPEDPDLRMRVERLRARAFASLGELEQLDEALDRLGTLGASQAELALVRGRAAVRRGEPEQAIEALREALAAKRPGLERRQRLRALLLLGNVLREQGRYSAALERYREARRIDPDHPAVVRFFDELERRR